MCICVLCVIIVHCTFYSVCNTDASDVGAIKITYLLTHSDRDTTNRIDLRKVSNEIIAQFLCNS